MAAPADFEEPGVGLSYRARVFVEVGDDEGVSQPLNQAPEAKMSRDRRARLPEIRIESGAPGVLSLVEMTGVLQLPDGREFEVRDGLTIGRVKSCGVVISDEKASRQHARLIVEAGVVEVEDLGSRNGTLLNGKTVRRRLIRDGDEIQIGRTVLRFVAASSSPGTDLGSMDLAGEDLFEAFDGPGEGPIDEPIVAPVVESAEPSAPSAESPIVEELDFADEPAPGDVDVIEFVDESVEVRRPSPAPNLPDVPEMRTRPQPLRDARSTAAARSASSAKPTASATGAASHRDGGVLQFRGNKSAGGAMGDDLAQAGGLQKLLLVGIGLAFAVGVAYVAMVLARG